MTKCLIKKVYNFSGLASIPATTEARRLFRVEL
jgi:hypothetical protein